MQFAALFRKFCRHEGGNFAIIFGLLLVPIAFSVGASVDYSQMHGRKTKMQTAVDTAIQAAARDANNVNQFARLADHYLAANLPEIKLEVTPKTGPKSVELIVVNKFPTSFLGLVGIPEVKITVNAELAIEKFGRGSAGNPGEKSPASQNPSASQIRSLVRELERRRDQMMQSVRNLPPREREIVRRQISRKFAHFIRMAEQGRSVSPVYLKK